MKKPKCVFMAASVEYLGHRIDVQRLHPKPENVEAVKIAPRPKNVMELKSYLGLLSYYTKFLPNLSMVLASLYQLLRADVSWYWGREQSEVFQKSKDLLLSSQALIHFDPSLEIVLACDASDYGLGAVFSHHLTDGSEKPVAFVSRTLSDSERKYSQIEKEALACVRSWSNQVSFLSLWSQIHLAD